MHALTFRQCGRGAKVGVVSLEFPQEYFVYDTKVFGCVVPKHLQCLVNSFSNLGVGGVKKGSKDGNCWF